MPGGLSFEIRASCGHARCGAIDTPHGRIDTPAFMPVGTRAALRGLTPQQVRATGAQIVLANTYHLLLRPGVAAVEQLGGLHRFMNWSGAILTDSGGYQVMSLADLRCIDDEGVVFQSHIDGERLAMTPESAIEAQNRLGADIIMALDECPRLPADRRVVDTAVRRTVAWGRRSRDAHRGADQALYGIVQGGLDLSLRRACLEQLVEIGFDGYAIGGLSVGEPPPEMWEMLREFARELPADRPRYLMGVGTPRDLVHAVAAGCDQFDCVLPTRNGRKGYAYTSEGVVRLRNAAYRTSARPLDVECECDTCRNFSRGYLRHLVTCDEVLGATLVSFHNLHYYQALMRQIRSAIESGDFEAWSQRFLTGPAARTSEDAK